MSFAMHEPHWIYFIASKLGWMGWRVTFSIWLKLDYVALYYQVDMNMCELESFSYHSSVKNISAIEQ